MLYRRFGRLWRANSERGLISSTSVRTLTLNYFIIYSKLTCRINEIVEAVSEHACWGVKSGWFCSYSICKGSLHQKIDGIGRRWRHMIMIRWISWFKLTITKIWSVAAGDANFVSAITCILVVVATYSAFIYYYKTRWSILSYFS